MQFRPRTTEIWQFLGRMSFLLHSEVVASLSFTLATNSATLYHPSSSTAHLASSSALSHTSASTLWCSSFPPKCLPLLLIHLPSSMPNMLLVEVNSLTSNSDSWSLCWCPSLDDHTYDPSPSPTFSPFPPSFCNSCNSCNSSNPTSYSYSTAHSSNSYSSVFLSTFACLLHIQQASLNSDFQLSIVSSLRPSRVQA